MKIYPLGTEIDFFADLEVNVPFLGTLVNFFVVLVTGTLGSLVKRGIPERISDAIMKAMGVCVVFIGIDGFLLEPPKVSDSAVLSDGLVLLIVVIISMGLGTLIGELIDIDRLVGRLGERLEERFAKGEGGNFARGFVSCSLLFSVGAMTVNGAFADALGNPDILLAKSVIDGITCFVMATTLGIGCAASAFFVLVYQGALTLLGLLLGSVLPAASVTCMSVTGSLVILLIGTNVLGATKVRTANMTPAIFIPALILPLIEFIL